MTEQPQRMNDKQTNGPSTSAVSETFVAYSPLSTDKVIELLSTLKNSRSGFGVAPGAPSLRIIIKDNTFTIMRKSAMKNPFARNLVGAVYPSENGSRIEYNLAINPMVRGLFGMWFAFVTIILLAGLTTLFSAGSNEVRYELIIAPIVLQAAALGVVSFGLNSSHPGESEFEQLMRHLTSSQTLAGVAE